MMKFLFFLVSLVFLSACATVPETIAVSEGTPLVNYTDIDRDRVVPSQSGEKARWGGEIVKIENKEKHSEIEIVKFPERSTGKPIEGAKSPGRFIAKVPGFIDPLVFEAGRLITVVGDIGTNINGQIGEQAYLYPTIDAEGFYVWQKTSEYDVQGYYLTSNLYGPFYRHRGFIYPWHDPYWGFPQQQRLRVIHRDAKAISGRTEEKADQD